MRRDRYVWWLGGAAVGVITAGGVWLENRDDSIWIYIPAAIVMGVLWAVGMRYVFQRWHK